MLTARYPVNLTDPRAHTMASDVDDTACAIAFSTIGPSANNSERAKLRKEQHATPSWNRLTSGDKQSGKMSGENSTKEAKKECKE